MYALEHLFIQFLLLLVPPAAINDVLHDPRTVAILIGTLIALASATLGTFLLLRGMSLTTDAISHTVLLGIIGAFLAMVYLFGAEPDLASPFLIVGAAAGGVLTVLLTELIYRSGLVRQDAALGLAFPFLFAISIILVSRFTANIHLDTDAVMVGEIGIAWTDTHSHCYANCDSVTITPADPRATVRRECTNCAAENLSPRSPQAIFAETCANCGTFSAAEAWSLGLLDTAPTLVFFPKSLSVMSVLCVIVVGFTLLFYKELKLTTFDAPLAAALGFRPTWLHYALMILVSLVAVGAFNAVGSVLVVAFFIIPPATAYLLTERLSGMLILSPLIGALGAYTGYDLSRGNFLGIAQVSDGLRLLDRTVGLGGYTDWNVSISASMVLMLLVWFVLAWIFAPRHGLVMTLYRRSRQRLAFQEIMVLGHLHHHENTAEADAECAPETLHEHLHWQPARTRWVLARLRAFQWVQLQAGKLQLTPKGRQRLAEFRQAMALD